jgi:hypothetical protein
MEKVLIKDINGILKKGIKITICSKLNNSINKMMAKVL